MCSIQDPADVQQYKKVKIHLWKHGFFFRGQKDGGDSRRERIAVMGVKEWMRRVEKMCLVSDSCNCWRLRRGEPGCIIKCSTEVQWTDHKWGKGGETCLQWWRLPKSSRWGLLSRYCTTLLFWVGVYSLTTRLLKISTYIIQSTPCKMILCETCTLPRGF